MEINNVIKLQQMKEISDMHRLRYQRKLHVTNNLIARLGLDAELEGHSGCVNCLEWNDKGSLLASGSDDWHIVIWDPFLRKKLQSIQSGHHGNIFSVKFIPVTNDGVIVSGAADCKIRVHDIIDKETTMACSCHGGRVKRLTVAPNVPFMFWSAAEDGLIMQFDLRVSHQCSNVCNNVLINLPRHLGRHAEAKCVTINPLRPHLLAVGANDPYVRLYDRRMLSPSTIEYPADSAPRPPWERQSYTMTALENSDDNLPSGCVDYFIAGHLPLKQTDYKKRYRTLTSTYLAFSPDGTELLANLGGEQIYLFDILNHRKQKTFDPQLFPLMKCCTLSKSSNNVEACLQTNGFIPHKNGTTNGVTTNGVTNHHLLPEKSATFASTEGTFEKRKTSSSKMLPPKVDKLKKRANEHFEKQQYTIAINLYNKGIYLCPSGAYLYGNRAAAYMKRGWDGDVYAALRDCHSALKLDPDYLKAHFRLARCLYELHWTKEALECLQAFKCKFPEYSQTHAFVSLEKDIRTAIFAETEAAEEASRSEKSNSSGQATSSRHPKPTFSEKEKQWRTNAYDYEARFCGHCNTTTDIKEANFFGSDGQYIVAGSDDGSFFMWDRVTTNIVRVLRGDDSIVNCLQPHPSSCLLATSGIDPVVRLWVPKPEDGSREDREILDSEDAAVANQKRMNADPLEVMLMNMGYRIPGVLDTEDVDSESGEPNIVQCRPS